MTAEAPSWEAFRATKRENERLRELLQQGYDPAAETIGGLDRVIKQLQTDLAAAREREGRLREALEKLTDPESHRGWAEKTYPDCPHCIALAALAREAGDV